MAKLRSQNGYSLIELVLVLVIIGILAGMAMKSLTAVTQTSRLEETRAELDQLAQAIAGDPSLIASGVRTDFGYLGDVGGLPPNLDALTTNPGGYTTWNGPYTGDEFTAGGSETEFKVDAWGVPYSYSGGISITSTGGPISLTRQIGSSVDDLLYNRVTVVVADLDRTPPGAVFCDSLQVILTYPNGSGSLVSLVVQPQSDGYAEFDSIPIGCHRLRLIYIPTDDTLSSRITVHPGGTAYSELSLADDLWNGS